MANVRIHGETTSESKHSSLSLSLSSVQTQLLSRAERRWRKRWGGVSPAWRCLALQSLVALTYASRVPRKEREDDRRRVPKTTAASSDLTLAFFVFRSCPSTVRGRNGKEKKCCRLSFEGREHADFVARLSRAYSSASSFGFRNRERMRLKLQWLPLYYYYEDFFFFFTKVPCIFI